MRPSGLTRLSIILIKYKLRIIALLDFITTFPIPRCWPIISCHSPLLFVFEVFIDSRHPRVDFVGKEPFAAFPHMICPVLYTFLCGFDMYEMLVSSVPDDICRPVYSVLNASWNVTKHFKAEGC